LKRVRNKGWRRKIIIGRKRTWRRSGKKIKMMKTEWDE
jgi:hypothetical protein